MQGGVIELARQAAAAARAERGARGPARQPVRRYRGVMLRDGMYVAQIMDAAGLRPVCLGSYETPEEAAYAYDAAARIMHGSKAKPNFPEPLAPASAGGGSGGAPAGHAGVFQLVGHARMRAPLNGQQPAPPQALAGPVGSGVPAAHAGVLPQVGYARMRAPLYGQQPAPHAGVLPLVGHARMRAPLYGQQPAPHAGVLPRVGHARMRVPLYGQQPAPHAGVLPLVGHARMRAPLYGQQPAQVGAGAQLQALSVQLAPRAPHFGAAPVPYHGGATPAFSQFMYCLAAGPAIAAAAGGSNGAGFYAAGPALAAAGGNNAAGFYGMALMIGPEPEVPMRTYAARSVLSSSVDHMESDSDGEAVVEDNFTTGDGGASTSSAARPAVPPLRLKDLMEAEVLCRSPDEGAP